MPVVLTIANLDILATSVFLGGAVLILIFALFSYMGVLSSRPTRREAFYAGKHVLITGGSSGIGKELARLLVDAGASVTIVARNERKLSDAAKELAPPDESRATAARVNTASCDCTDSEAVGKMIDDVESLFGPIDILVNSAGTAFGGYFEDLQPKSFQNMMNLNYFVQLFPTHATFKKMAQRRTGHIVLVSSVAGQAGVLGHSAYAPAKFALCGLGEVLSCEGKPYGIDITVVYPPDTDTPGYETEKDTVPPETHEISNTAGFFRPETVAKDMADGIMRKQYRVTTGFMGKMVGIVAAGCGPGVSVADVLLMPIVRAVIPFLLWGHNRIVRRGHAVRFPDADKTSKKAR